MLFALIQGLQFHSVELQVVCILYQMGVSISLTSGKSIRDTESPQERQEREHWLFIYLFNKCGRHWSLALCTKTKFNYIYPYPNILSLPTLLGTPILLRTYNIFGNVQCSVISLNLTMTSVSGIKWAHLSILETANLFGFSHTAVSKVYNEWFQKNILWVGVCRQKHLVDENDQKWMTRPVCAVRKFIITQINTLYYHGEQKHSKTLL